MKVSLIDKKIVLNVFNTAMLIGTIVGIISIFFNNYILENKLYFILAYIGIIIIYYIVYYIYLNFLTNITLKIHNSDFVIKQGDIFKQQGLKVINFNEYFDTEVNNIIIAENSLNGIFIKQYVDNVNELDKLIDEKVEYFELLKERKGGKNKKYKLGSIVEYKDFLLTSLTKFDENNLAIINLKDYLSFLMNFWDNLNKIYANRNVTITLFGSSSLTRFTDAYDINDQELLEIIIWTFQISKIKFKYPTKITLILSKETMNRINLHKLKERYEYGL